MSNFRWREWSTVWIVNCTLSSQYTAWVLLMVPCSLNLLIFANMTSHDNMRLALLNQIIADDHSSWCHLVSTHACQITSAHITTGQNTDNSWCQLIPHQVRSADVSLYHIRSDQLMSAYNTSGQITWCQLMSHQVRSHYVSLCHIKSDHLMSAYITSGQITFQSKIGTTWSKTFTQS